MMNDDDEVLKFYPHNLLYSLTLFSSGLPCHPDLIRKAALLDEFGDMLSHAIALGSAIS